MPEFYSWRSDALKQYGSGWILVSAETVEEARARARLQFPEWLKQERSYLFGPDGAPDELSEDQFTELMTKLDTDLAADPHIHQCLFIEGSE